MDYKAVIFDLDGLLIDSMRYWLDLDKKFFSDLNISITQDDVKYMTGRSRRENFAWLIKKYNLSHSVDEMVSLTRPWTDQIYEEFSKPMPGANELIVKIDKTNKKQAIASGVTHRHIQVSVKLNNWEQYFSHLVSSEHVGHIGKPNPAIYLHAANLLQAKPEECIVIEDAQNGVEAAKKAGMRCVAIPDERWSFGDFSQADLVAGSLEDRSLLSYLSLN